MKAGTEFRPSLLKCEHSINPVGISAANPRFSWQMTHPGTSRSQSAYRIIVTDTAENTVWDSGEVKSSQQNGIIYKGKPLSILSKYNWKVMIWDESGNPSAWSDQASFETGFFSISKWPSAWLGVGEYKSAVHIRKEFELDTLDGISKARAYLASTTGAFGNLTMRMNLYKCLINGSKAGNDVVSPGQLSERKRRALYRSFDILPLLKKGKNTIGIISIADAISIFLAIEYENGKTVSLGTDGTWKMNGPGPYTLWAEGVNEHGGKTERYDSLAEYSGWDKPGFDDSMWESAVETAPAKILTAQIQTIGEFERIKPVSSNKNILDFGQNMHGHLTLQAKGERGASVRIRYSERLADDGQLDPKSTINFAQGERGAQEDVYILRGEGQESYAPDFANHGFRYAEIITDKAELIGESVEARFIHSPVLSKSYFRCSDPLLNKLHDISFRSFRSNLVSVPTDCPHRERNAWMGDALCVAEAECLNFDMAAFFDKWFDDISDAQLDNGEIPYICPFPDWDSKKMQLDIPWSSAAVTVPWDAFMAYGDKSILEKCYPMMKKWIDYLESLSGPESLIKGGVRWNDHMGDERPANDFIGNAYYFRCVSLISKIASALSNYNDSKYYEKLSNKLKDAINANFLNGRSFYDNNSQSSNAHAVYFGLLPDEECRTKVIESILQGIAMKKGRTTGCLGTYCLIPVLSESGNEDTVLSLISSTKKSSWGYWIKELGATTSIESWLGVDSFNHPFLVGSLDAWFYKSLAGISATAPGYEKIRIRPWITQGLDNAEAQVDTVRGPVKSKWKRNKEQIVMEVSIPFNSSAVIYVPSSQEPESDIKPFGQEKNNFLYEAGAGNYRFRTTASQ